MTSAAARTMGAHSARMGAACLVAALLVCGDAGLGAAETEPGTFDGLVPIEGAQVAHAYIDPHADFSVFERVRILEPYVAFRSNWQRDQNRNRSRRVRSSDMERIKRDVGALFMEVFTEVLESNDGFEVVDVVDDDVLILRPAIIDLDVTAPDTQTGGRASTFTATTGAATLYIELFDSVSGAIIGRAADRRVVRSPGSTVTWSNRVTNSADARRLFRRWAERLRGFLDDHYQSPASESTEK